MDIGYYKNLRRKNRFLGADDDFVGPPSPIKDTTGINAVFGGLSSIAKTVSDSIIQGQLSVNKNGISYTGIPSTVPQMQYAATTPPKPDYTRYLWIAIPALAGVYLITKRK
jgi:hypothetical protein